MKFLKKESKLKTIEFGSFLTDGTETDSTYNTSTGYAENFKSRKYELIFHELKKHEEYLWLV
jgi:hypothetical protein